MPGDSRLTVADARRAMLEEAHKGVACPCCGQHVKVYQRAVTPSMLRWLFWLYLEWTATEDAWVDIKDSPVRGGDYAKLTYWRLAEQLKVSDKERGRSAFWRPTPLATALLVYKQPIARYCEIYNGQLLGWSEEETDVARILKLKRWSGWAIWEESGRWHGPFAERWQAEQTLARNVAGHIAPGAEIVMFGYTDDPADPWWFKRPESDVSERMARLRKAARKK